MASILSSVNQTDIIIDKRLTSVSPYGSSTGGGGGSGGGGGGSGGGSATGDSGGNYTTSTSPAVWFAYNSSSTHTIENSNASRHFADHPETSGAVGMEAIIIVVVVSLIPVSVIACMVFVISFNCLKRRSSLWSTNASPEATEHNLVAKAQAQLARVDSGGVGNGNRRKSGIHSMMDEEILTDANLFNSGDGSGRENSDQITMLDTPLSLICPADAFSAAAYLETSKSSLTTPISNNSVITMTMRNNHLIVETEERIPVRCSLLDEHHWYRGGIGGSSSAGMGIGAGDTHDTCTSNVYAQCQVEKYAYAYELNDDSVLDETDSLCESRYCQHGTSTACVAEQCVFCQDYDDDDESGGDGQKTFYNTATTVSGIVAPSTATTIDNCNRPSSMQTDEEDQAVQLFHKDIAAAAVTMQHHRQPVQLLNNDDGDVSGGVHESHHLSLPQVDLDANADEVVIRTGYSQSDAGDSSRYEQNHYVYGNQSEYVASARNKRFAAGRFRRPESNTTTANAPSVPSSLSISCSVSNSSSPPPLSTSSVHLESASKGDDSFTR